MKWEVIITETLTEVVEVEADNKEDAKTQAIIHRTNEGDRKIRYEMYPMFDTVKDDEAVSIDHQGNLYIDRSEERKEKFKKAQIIVNEKYKDVFKKLAEMD